MPLYAVWNKRLHPVALPPGWEVKGRTPSDENVVFASEEQVIVTPGLDTAEEVLTALFGSFRKLPDDDEAPERPL